MDNWGIDTASEDTNYYRRLIKERRKALDLTQRALALNLGCSESTIRKIEAGILRPSRQIAELLAERLDIPPEQSHLFVRNMRDIVPAPTTPAPEETSRQSRTNSPGSGAGDLPIPPTTLVGRERELAGAAALLRRDEVRLVTLTGAPGSGKTRLAIELAGYLADDFADGVAFVSLAIVGEADLVLPTIAQVLGVGESSDSRLRDSLKYYLYDKNLLLLLDNFEQVIEAGVELAELLATAPGLKLLVTSREELTIRGERIFPVPPLDLPDLDASAEALMESAAVALFTARAGDIQPDFKLDEENRLAVAAITHRLEGNPLAIELAAARISLLPPSALLERMESRLALLTNGARDLPPRQRTLHNAIGWSYNLLDSDEQLLLQQLAVFANGATLAALVAVCSATASGPVDETSVLAGLDSLRRKSLLQRDMPNGEPRFRMLELIREFAAAQLAAGPLEATVRNAHSRYFLALAESAAPHLSGLDQRVWFALLDREHANLRAALHWLLGQEELASAARLVAALGAFWYLHGYWSEGRRLLHIVLDRATLSLTTRARLLQYAGVLSSRQGDAAVAHSLFQESEALWRESSDIEGLAGLLQDQGAFAVLMDEYSHARVVLEESLALQRQVGNRRGAANTLVTQAYRGYIQGEFDLAETLLNEALHISTELGDEAGISKALYHLGRLAYNRGDYSRADSLLAERFSLEQALGDKGGIASTLKWWGLVALAQGNYSRATALIDESLARFHTLGSRGEAAVALYCKSRIALHQEDYALAARCARESLRVLRSAGAPYDISNDMLVLSATAAAAGDYERSARLAGAAETLVAALGAVLDPLSTASRLSLIAAAQAALGKPHFEAAWCSGRSMTLDEASDYALDERHTSVTPVLR